MPLVQAKCTNCGGSLQVDTAKKAAVCPYCHEAYIVEEAINNYVTNIENLQANVVNIIQKGEDDFVIRAGVLEKYNGADTEIIIPDGVKAINGAFRNCEGITSVIIPSGVKKIGKSSFSGCRDLIKVVMHEGVSEIGEHAFSDCVSLQEIFFPQSIKNIGELAFLGCESIKSIRLQGNDIVLGDRVFAKCIGIKDISIYGDRTSIGANAFDSCKSLEQFSIHGNWKWIGGSVFYNCPALTTMTIDGKGAYASSSWEDAWKWLPKVSVFELTRESEMLKNHLKQMYPNAIFKLPEHEQKTLDAERQQLLEEKTELQARFSALGLFAGAEKKALKLQIAEIEKRISELNFL